MHRGFVVWTLDGWDRSGSFGWVAMERTRRSEADAFSPTSLHPSVNFSQQFLLRTAGAIFGICGPSYDASYKVIAV
jgi:hypothetical protein